MTEARELAAIARADVQFVRTDVLESDCAYDGLFDFVFISEGSLQWFQSLTDYLAVVRRLLKTGGRILVFEIHPFAYLFEHSGARQKPITLDDFPSYFEPGPFSYPKGMDYAGGTEYEAKPCRWFMHRLADILTALARNGFELMEMSEHEFNLAANKQLEGRSDLPLCYLLHAKKR